jgi:NAD+ kinase
MRLQIVGLERQALTEYIAAKHPHFDVVESAPDVIVCYGGDGTLLYGERKHPGVPKIMIRNSQVCANCSRLAKDTVLTLLHEGKYTIVDHVKIEAHKNDAVLFAMNDIVLAHPQVNGTLRAKVFINHQQYGEAILGDGIVVSTPIGSTGYYQSITRSHFQSGIGIAFNNTVNIVSHLVVNENTHLEVEVIRGPGLVAADNDENHISLSTGDRVQVVASAKKARLIHFAQEHARFHMSISTDRVPLGFCQICRERYEDL